MAAALTTASVCAGTIAQRSGNLLASALVQADDFFGGSVLDNCAQAHLQLVAAEPHVVLEQKHIYNAIASSGSFMATRVSKAPPTIQRGYLADLMEVNAKWLPLIHSSDRPSAATRAAAEDMSLSVLPPPTIAAMRAHKRMQSGNKAPVATGLRSNAVASAAVRLAKARHQTKTKLRTAPATGPRNASAASAGGDVSGMSSPSREVGRNSRNKRSASAASAGGGVSGMSSPSREVVCDSRKKRSHARASSLSDDDIPLSQSEFFKQNPQRSSSSASIAPIGTGWFAYNTSGTAAAVPPNVPWPLMSLAAGAPPPHMQWMYPSPMMHAGYPPYSQHAPQHPPSQMGLGVHGYPNYMGYPGQ